MRTERGKDNEVPLGLTRLDISPQFRYPLSRWPFLGVTASLAWRNTFYSESFDDTGARVPTWLTRQFMDMRADVTGPTFTRIFDTKNGFADRIKHVIEPSFDINRSTLIDNYDRIVKLDSYDYTFGGTTRITYGLVNRLLARRPGSRQGSAREFVTVQLSQTYYSDERASQVDPSYGSSFQGLEPRTLSPWLLSARVAPSDRWDAGTRLEYDQYTGDLLTIGASGRFAYRDVVQATSGWSRRQITETRADNYWNLGTTVRALNGSVGGFFGFDYDLFRDQMLQRRVQAYYNAQCCGVAFEFQTFNFPYASSRFIVPRDRRFNLTFTLAGIGTFSNVFGVFDSGDSSRQR